MAADVWSLKATEGRSTTAYKQLPRVEDVKEDGGCTLHAVEKRTGDGDGGREVSGAKSNQRASPRLN